MPQKVCNLREQTKATSIGYRRKQIQIPSRAERDAGIRRFGILALTDCFKDICNDPPSSPLLRTLLGGERLDENKASNQLEALTRANQALRAEIARRQEAEEELRLLQAVIRALAEAQDFHSASKMALRQICEQTGWDYGEIWVPNASEDVLQFEVAWHRENEDLDRFRSYSESLRFTPGLGLPGRVWQAKQSKWLQDITSRTRGICPLRDGEKMQPQICVGNTRYRS